MVKKTDNHIRNCFDVMTQTVLSAKHFNFKHFCSATEKCNRERNGSSSNEHLTIDYSPTFTYGYFSSTANHTSLVLFFCLVFVLLIILLVSIV